MISHATNILDIGEYLDPLDKVQVIRALGLPNGFFCRSVKIPLAIIGFRRQEPYWNLLGWSVTLPINERTIRIQKTTEGYRIDHDPFYWIITSVYMHGRYMEAVNIDIDSKDIIESTKFINQ